MMSHIALGQCNMVGSAYEILYALSATLSYWPNECIISFDLQGLIIIKERIMLSARQATDWMSDSLSSKSS